MVYWRRLLAKLGAMQSLGTVESMRFHTQGRRQCGAGGKLPPWHSRICKNYCETLICTCPMHLHVTKLKCAWAGLYIWCACLLQRKGAWWSTMQVKFRAPCLWEVYIAIMRIFLVYKLPCFCCSMNSYISWCHSKFKVAILRGYKITVDLFLVCHPCKPKLSTAPGVQPWPDTALVITMSIQ